MRQTNTSTKLLESAGMREEQPPMRLNSLTVFNDSTLVKGNYLPPLPKTLNHYFSETTYHSSH